MLARLGAYLIAFVVLGSIPYLCYPIMMTVAWALRKAYWVAPLVFCVLDAVMRCCSIFLAAWLINRIGQSPSWLMFLIPWYLMVQNDVMRINRVKAGKSNLKRMHEQAGQPESYDQRLDLWVERGHLAGDVVGWTAGANLTLQAASFF